MARRSISMPGWACDRVGDVGGGDRPEEPAALARPGLDVDAARR